MEIKFVYLVCGDSSIIVCDTYEIALEILKDSIIFDPSVSIQKKVLFNKDVY